jgi:hypothetical protein
MANFSECPGSNFSFHCFPVRNMLLFSIHTSRHRCCMQVIDAIHQSTEHGEIHQSKNCTSVWQRRKKNSGSASKLKTADRWAILRATTGNGFVLSRYEWYMYGQRRSELVGSLSLNDFVGERHGQFQSHLMYAVSNFFSKPHQTSVFHTKLNLI